MKTATCDSCAAEYELREVEVLASKNEGFWGHRPIRCECPKCGAVIVGLEPEAAEIANPKAWVVAGVLLVCIVILAFAPKALLEPVGLIILGTVGFLGILYGEEKHKVWSAILISVCAYLAYELSNII